jgi:hypothetical protein
MGERQLLNRKDAGRAQDTYVSLSQPSAKGSADFIRGAGASNECPDGLTPRGMAEYSKSWGNERNLGEWRQAARFGQQQPVHRLVVE